MAEGFVAWPSVREGYDNDGRGYASWYTLVSGDRTPSDTLCAGLMELPSAGPGLPLHRHSQAEIYHVIEGEGVVTIDGVRHPVRAGATVFIPGDAEHGARNTGPNTLQIFYTFAADRYGDVVYRYSGK